jgi:hypothetical protein
MALQGDLGSIDIADILSVISLNQKTGMLIITRGFEEKKLYFRKGRLIFSSSTNENEKLGEIMIDEGYLERGDITVVVEEQRNSEDHIGTILLEKGIISQEQLFNCIRVQANRILLTILNWIDGSFRFSDEEVKLPKQLSIAYDLNKLILEVATKTDELMKVKKSLPDFNLKPRMTPDFDNQNNEITINKDEWKILYLADGERSISDLCYLTGNNDLETCVVIKNLIDKELLMLPGYEMADGLSTDERLQRIQMETILTLYNQVFRLLHRKAFDLDKDIGRDIIMNAFKNVSSEDDSILFKNIILKKDGSMDKELLFENIMKLPSSERLNVIYKKLGSLITRVISNFTANFHKEEVEDVKKSISEVVDFLIHQNQNILVKVGMKQKIEKSLKEI